MLRYFAYGSNMSRVRLVTRVGEVEVQGHALLKDFQHAFDKRGEDGTAKGNIIRVEGATVHGVLYRLTREQMTALRQFEGGYVRTTVTVAFPDHSAPVAQAETFMADDAHRQAGLSPAAWYLNHYRDGAREHGLPEDYLAQILAV